MVRRHLQSTRALLNEAATALLVAFTDGQRFTDDVHLLSELEPSIRFVVGDTPEEVRVVRVSVPDPATAYLCTRTDSGVGLYLRLTWEEGGCHGRTMASDPSRGPSGAQIYEVISD
jgi:hypothetical protein